MCDLNCVNLIDLNLEDENLGINKQLKSECCPQLFEENLFMPPIWYKTESLDNNPFDHVQKLADRVDDAFDIVEKEASLKALHDSKLSSEVKLGNLLSLSDDNFLNYEQNPDLELESPPVIINEKQSSDNASVTDTDSNPNSSTEISVSAKLNKNMEYRKRLLKLSISNANAYSTPIAIRQSLEVDDMLCTPVSSMLSRAAEFGEHLLASESPLKFAEDEDLMSEEPPNFIDSEKNFEADLEMLRIPILNELASQASDTPSIKSIESTVENKSTNLDDIIPNMEKFKAKLRAKKDEITNNRQQKISSLIQNLKILISSGEMVDSIKKQKASDLLESLSSALEPINKENSVKKSCEMIEIAQHTIKRQGTFDLELQENQETNIDNQPLVQEMSTCMVSSSATFDGEKSDENENLNLPEIEPLPYQTLQSQCHNLSNNNLENHSHNNVNNIVEQLGKIFINNTADNPPSSNNPTFIFVMNANQFDHSSLNSCDQNDVDAKQRSSYVANYLENSLNDGSPDFTKVSPMPRRRSQSLSIHDKVNIVTLPLHQPIPRSIERKNYEQLDISPPTVTTPPSAGKESLEFKTPARIMRRNSYSSGTPFTVQVDSRSTGFGYENKNRTKLRRTQILDTHHEGQQQAIVRPMSMLSKNLPQFKPDLKKKSKHNTQSIIKASGPLKATIPVKKVAPMLKTSPPTPEANSRTEIRYNMSLQDQSRIKSKGHTTPLKAKENSILGVRVEYPNAYSTPTSFTSPLKRTTGPINKPRYSYISATPNHKRSVTNTISPASLKRPSITDFKTKAPLRPPGSSSPAASSSKASYVTTRLSTSAEARFLKTPVKKPIVNTAVVKTPCRLSSRASVGGSILSARNKENKRP